MAASCAVGRPNIRPYFEVQRAKMILMAAQGMSNDEISTRLDTRREVVSLWRKRFYKERLAGLEERARPGRVHWRRVFIRSVGLDDEMPRLFPG